MALHAPSSSFAMMPGSSPYQGVLAEGKGGLVIVTPGYKVANEGFRPTPNIWAGRSRPSSTAANAAGEAIASPR